MLIFSHYSIGIFAKINGANFPTELCSFRTHRSITPTPFRAKYPTVLLHPSFFYFSRRSISITGVYYPRRSISTSILLSPRSCFFTSLLLPCFLFGPPPFYPNIIEKCLKIRDFSPFFFFFHKNPA